MRKTGVLAVAVIAIVGGIFVVYGDVESPAGYATGTAASSADTLLRDLKSRNRKVRKSAATTLARVGDLGALRPLSEALTDDDMAVAAQARRAIDRIVKRFPKNLGAFADTSYHFELRAIINDSGEGGDLIAGAVKDGILAELLNYDNIQVGTSTDFDTPFVAGAGKKAPVNLDLSGRLESIEGGKATLQLELALTDVNVVVKRWKKVTGEGTEPRLAAEAAGSEAGTKVLSYLGAPRK